MIRVVDRNTKESMPCRDGKDIAMNLTRVLQGRDPKFKGIKHAVASQS